MTAMLAAFMAPGQNKTKKGGEMQAEWKGKGKGKGAKRHQSLR